MAMTKANTSTPTAIKAALAAGLDQVAQQRPQRPSRVTTRTFDATQIRPTPKLKRRRHDCKSLDSDADVFTQSHQTWMNWGITDNALTTGGELFTRKLFRPTDPYEIAQAIREAEAAGVTIRALGSGFSFSDAVMPQQAVLLEPPFKITPKMAKGFELGYGFAIDMTSCQKSLQATFVDLVTEPHHTETHVFVEGGITIQDLNIVLDHQNPRVALHTMGGSSGQTIAGAISTGTHGGDFDRRPLADQVQALYVIGRGGKHHWIERRANVTDRKKLVRAFPCLTHAHIHFDDQMFNEVLVSIGAMGVIYACVVRVVPQFTLLNWNASSTWRSVTKHGGEHLSKLRDGTLSGLKTYLTAAFKHGRSMRNHFAQVVINPVPHEDTGEFTCYVTNRITLPLQLTPPSGPAATGLNNVTPDDLKNAVQNAPEATGIGTEILEALIGGSLLGFGGLWGTGGVDLANKIVLAGSMSGGIADQALALIKFAEDHDDAWMVRVVIDAILRASFPVSSILGEPTSGLDNKVVRVMAAHPTPGPQVDLAWKIMTGGVVTSRIPVISMEAAFPIDEALLFIDSALLHFAHTVFPPASGLLEIQTKPPRIPAGYVSLRICGETEAVLGMQKHDPTAMVEVALLGNNDDARMIQHLESVALGHESIFSSTNLPDIPTATLKHGVLHWGQANGRMTKADVQARYGKAAITKWVALQHELGGKTFVNEMMRRLGLA